MRDTISANPAILRLIYERLVKFLSRMYSSWSIDKQCDIVEVIQAGAPENLHRDYQQTEYAAAIEKHEWLLSVIRR
ncbi:uncharacterized protein PITG_18524 [Phytophthora infestans T30-4]|uniref:Uncharacterized protein n=1 Tax=Phytophthora infestans (strain T30-4) TaxID=403677 RepID=D0NY91_PHYIT|nr:uncharacterized protein PITG_18524 [Phytophthora infestans T30-4]EEY68080.1 hypothetical protein PITG_18524 [Phytophthora infestans T30-4]|eukprot:XP_002997638.1 hypothetical protein PITG_18524 [Phytophthora infestans T30-4]